jgi:hypothetical protein
MQNEVYNVSRMLRDLLSEEKSDYVYPETGARETAANSSAQAQREQFLVGGGHKERRGSRVPVVAEGGRLAYAWRERGDSLPLHNVVDPNPPLAAERMTRIYFRTESADAIDGAPRTTSRARIVVANSVGSFCNIKSALIFA